MTRDEKIIRNKVGVLELAKQLGSVSHACRIMGFSRDSFYRFKDLYAALVTAVLGASPAYAHTFGASGAGFMWRNAIPRSGSRLVADAAPGRYAPPR